jgi:hypothetical protein
MKRINSSFRNASKSKSDLTTTTENEYGLESPSSTEKDGFSYGDSSFRMGNEEEKVSKQKAFMAGQTSRAEQAHGHRKHSTMTSPKGHKGMLRKHTTFVEDIRKEGVLRKRGHMLKNWKDRYFMLEDGVLKYSEGTTAGGTCFRG